MVHVLMKEVPASATMSQVDVLMDRVKNAVAIQLSLPWYYWSMLVAAGLFNAVSLSYDDYTLLPQVFHEIDNPIKIGLVETSGYAFLGVVGLGITWLYYGKG
ncbi:hypothetical protein Pmani_012731 [Petrolisthes manimaculis]|uniref:Uncharacterized protein n=1 Tax=Petrolisthes manimaculis TaxID=1843537 RepID=A0AAE1PZW4_9EUCA|nr:hypothetical protein Pmani_012731 [Petrolisthes manimaculis]